MPKAKLKIAKTPVKSPTKRSKSHIIYLDNNATTPLCSAGAKALLKNCACYNPSSDSAIAKPSRDIITTATDYIRNLVNAMDYTVIFTSGATESNCCIMRSVADAYKRITSQIPHFIISKTEHISIISCAESMLKNQHIEVSWLKPTVFGTTIPADVEKLIKPNTALIICMYANNEVGCINNLTEITKIAHEHDIPVFSDCVQIFGKHIMDMSRNGIDAFSASFHKFYGPKGLGLLVISNDLLNGYKLEAQINGHQQNNLRGGTENVPAIAAGLATCKWNFAKREAKSAHLAKLRNRLIEGLQKHFPVQYWAEYVQQNKQPDELSEPTIFIFGSKTQKTMLPNTLLISIADPSKKFCNVEFKKALDKVGVVVSIGSACNTHEKNASHVVSALNTPDFVKRGVLRISLGDANTTAEIDTVLNIMVNMLKPTFDQ